MRKNKEKMAHKSGKAKLPTSFEKLRPGYFIQQKKSKKKLELLQIDSGSQAERDLLSLNEQEFAQKLTKDYLKEPQAKLRLFSQIIGELGKENSLKLYQDVQIDYGTEKNQNLNTNNKLRSPGGIFLKRAKALNTKREGKELTLGQLVIGLCNQESKRARKEFQKEASKNKAHFEEQKEE